MWDQQTIPSRLRCWPSHSHTVKWSRLIESFPDIVLCRGRLQMHWKGFYQFNTNILIIILQVVWYGLESVSSLYRCVYKYFKHVSDSEVQSHPLVASFLPWVLPILLAVDGFLHRFGRGRSCYLVVTWRIIPFSKWLVTPIYKPFRPFGRGTTLLRGLTIHGY